MEKGIPVKVINVHRIAMPALRAGVQILLKLSKKYSSNTYHIFFFITGIIFLGINQGILNSTFNNYLYDNFSLSVTDRGLIEFPRELPGLLSILITGFLTWWSVRSWAVLVGVLSAIGVLGLGLFSPSINIMILWMFLWSMADHLFISVESIVGLKLSKENHEGRRLGQISGARNLSALIGTGIVFLLFERVNFKELSLNKFYSGYSGLYLLATITALMAALAFSRMKMAEDASPPKRFVLNKCYNIFYIMNLLFGARKQIFLTFAPWVLVSIYNTPTQTMALLFFLVSLLGFIFRQYFGIMVDRWGEKIVLEVDSFILLFVCLSFALAKHPYLLYACFVIEGLMFATRIARTTYLKKIIVDPRDLQPTISLGISIDHVASMIVPLIGGFLWHYYGFHLLFLIASILSFFNLFVALKLNSTPK